jgi:hypothetical protein
MVNDLHQGNVDLTTSPLDSLVASYDHYAYVGNRRDLKDQVLRLSSGIRDRIGQLAGFKHPPNTASDEEWASWWYGTSKWERNSGVFPDFVLACVGENADYYWRGAFLELKDSKGAALASFNSTLPSSTKDIRKTSDIVKRSVDRYDLPISKQKDYPKNRRCFYLVRTKSNSEQEVRVSIVEGTFFETVPNSELLSQVWKQLLNKAKVPDMIAEQVIEYLASLEREDIAVSRHVCKASIKPRLRIMSEVERDGNPHTYNEIPARSVNLIVKPVISEGVDEERWLRESIDWFTQQAKAEGLVVHKANSQNLSLALGCQEFQLTVRFIHHRRNGRHLVLQYQC